MQNNLPVILVADDDAYVQRSLSEALKGMFSKLLLSSTAKDTWRLIAEEQPECIVLDLYFPDSKDLSLLKRIKQEYPHIEVLIISGDTNSTKIVQCIKTGAYDYVTKPFIREELRNRIAHISELQQIRKSQQALLQDLDTKSGLSALIGETDEIKRARTIIRKVADGHSNVLICGESGTGKELVARAIHFSSKRVNNPFVTLNAAAIPEALTEGTLFGHRRGAFTGAVESAKGAFEQAQDGTLFLDEIGDMPLLQQAALLRAIENRRYRPIGETVDRETHARFIFATNQNLTERIRANRFREDLFYRINAVTIQLPPLRQRAADIQLLVQYFVMQLTSSMGRPHMHVTLDVIKHLQKYHWPGNVRELRNVLETAIMLCEPKADEITLDKLPLALLQAQSEKISSSLTHVLAQNEAKEILRVLRMCHGNQCQAAAILGIHRNTLRKKVRDYRINPNGV